MVRPPAIPGSLREKVEQSNERVSVIVGSEDDIRDYNHDHEDPLDLEAEADTDRVEDTDLISNVVGCLARCYGSGNTYIQDGKSIIVNLSTIDKTIAGVVSGSLAVPSLAKVKGDASISFKVADATSSVEAMAKGQVETYVGDTYDLKEPVWGSGVAHDMQKHLIRLERHYNEPMFFKDSVGDMVMDLDNQVFCCHMEGNSLNVYYYQNMSCYNFDKKHRWTGALGGPIRAAITFPGTQNVVVLAGSALWSSTEGGDFVQNQVVPATLANLKIQGGRMFAWGLGTNNSWMSSDGVTWTPFMADSIIDIAASNSGLCLVQAQYGTGYLTSTDFGATQGARTASPTALFGVSTGTFMQHIPSYNGNPGFFWIDLNNQYGIIEEDFTVRACEDVPTNKRAGHHGYVSDPANRMTCFIEADRPGIYYGLGDFVTYIVDFNKFKHLSNTTVDRGHYAKQRPASVTGPNNPSYAKFGIKYANSYTPMIHKWDASRKMFSIMGHTNSGYNDLCWVSPY